MQRRSGKESGGALSPLGVIFDLYFIGTGIQRAWPKDDSWCWFQDSI
jgi:hypothetical protein